jgi:hypothetical protein
MQEQKLGQKRSMFNTRVPVFGSVRHWSAYPPPLLVPSWLSLAVWAGMSIPYRRAVFSPKIFQA